jgi:hypothetical protein
MVLIDHHGEATRQSNTCNSPLNTFCKIDFFSSSRSAVHKKPVLNWLNDLKEKASLEDRLLAQKILTDRGIDARGLLTEV